VCWGYGVWVVKTCSLQLDVNIQRNMILPLEFKRVGCRHGQVTLISVTCMEKCSFSQFLTPWLHNVARPWRLQLSRQRWHEMMISTSKTALCHSPEYYIVIRFLMTKTRKLCQISVLKNKSLCDAMTIYSITVTLDCSDWSNFYDIKTSLGPLHPPILQWLLGTPCPAVKLTQHHVTV
jgi:hypothetical protein